MKKIIVLIIMLLLITGCNVREDITINKDLTVVESVKMTGTPEFFNNRYMMLPVNVLREILESDERESYLKENGYDYKIDTNETYPFVLATKKYESIDKFTDSTIFKFQYFAEFKTTYNDNLVTMKASKFNEYEDGDIEQYPIKTCSINIKLPYVVTDSNADKVDKRTNTYIWNIKEDTENKEIIITFDKNRTYIYNLSWYISLGIIILMVIIAAMLIIRAVRKNKLNNGI